MLLVYIFVKCIFLYSHVGFIEDLDGRFAKFLQIWELKPAFDKYQKSLTKMSNPGSSRYHKNSEKKSVPYGVPVWCKLNRSANRQVLLRIIGLAQPLAS